MAYQFKNEDLKKIDEDLIKINDNLVTKEYVDNKVNEYYKYINEYHSNINNILTFIIGLFVGISIIKSFFNNYR